MTEAAVAAEIHQALDALLHFAARVAFDLDRGVDGVADGLDVGLGQLVDLAALGDVRLLSNRPSSGGTNAVDVRKSVSNCLAAGQIYTSDTSHFLILSLGAACDVGCRR